MKKGCEGCQTVLEFILIQEEEYRDLERGRYILKEILYHDNIDTYKNLAFSYRPDYAGTATEWRQYYFWLEQAAHAGNSWSNAALGDRHHFGTCFGDKPGEKNCPASPDIEKTFKYYYQCCGDIEDDTKDETEMKCGLDIAAMREGRASSGKIDYDEAQQIHKFLAARGQYQSQINYALMFADGKCMPRDLGKALTWCLIAHKTAGDYMHKNYIQKTCRSLELKMDEMQIRESRNASARFKPIMSQ